MSDNEQAAPRRAAVSTVKVRAREKGEVLSAFAAHEDEVTQGYVAAP